MADVVADMAGIVATFLVDDGQHVGKNEPVCEIECMKSFFPVEAPVAGIVRFKVSLGEAIGQDQVVAIIEEG